MSVYMGRIVTKAVVMVTAMMVIQSMVMVTMHGCNDSQELNDFKDKHAKEIRAIDEGRQVGCNNNVINEN